MTQKKKAELQRKLSMSAVPTPPADLAKRIKAQIPDPLMTVKADRERFSNSIAFSMRVAASIVLLVTSVALSVHLMSRGEMPFATSEDKAEQSQPSAVAAIPEKEKDSVVPRFADTAQITVTLAEETGARKDAVVSNVAPPSLQAKAESAAQAEQPRRDEPRPVATAPAHARIGAVAGVVTDAIDESERSRDVVARRSVAVAATPTAPPPPPPPPPAVEPSAAANDFAAEAELITVTAQAPIVTVPAPAPSPEVSATVAESRGLGKASRAADASYNTARRTIFGLSVDPGEFSRVKSMIESGRKPSDNVDVEAIVNHFAGVNAPPMTAIRLQVEGSRLPIARDPSLLMLRFTVDTAAPQRRASGPIGTDAKIEVILNRNALLRHRVIGNTGELEASEGVLQRGSSVTGLIELRIKPGVAAWQEIATVRLTYRSKADGRTKTEVKSVTARDLDKSWTAATRRHRLATLGAVWGESLRVESAADDVARAAEGLAEEVPGDDRARDLAAAATASSRLRSSLPTGSGR